MLIVSVTRSTSAGSARAFRYLETIHASTRPREPYLLRMLAWTTSLNPRCRGSAGRCSRVSGQPTGFDAEYDGHEKCSASTFGGLADGRYRRPAADGSEGHGEPDTSRLRRDPV